MIEEGTPMPESFNVESEAYSEGWRLVTNLESYGLDRKLRKAGWNFLYMAAQVRVTVVGFGRERTIRSAFKKIVGRTRQSKCNCLEITHANPKQIMGFVYLSISGHARNIQQPAS